MPIKKTTTATKAVESNARHIEENSKEIQNNTKMIHLLYGIIIVLMMVIAALAFYVGTKTGSSGTVPAVTQAKDIEITIIDDARCSECQTEAIVTQLKTLPFLSAATYIEKDFSDAGISAYLEENSITALPAVIFNTNTLSDGGQIAPYLTALTDEQYSLAVGSTFDPFAKRSEKGFLMLEKEQVDRVLANSYLKGPADAQITWLEYTDLNCHFCQKMEDDGTAQAVLDKFPETLNKTTHNFIGVGGQASQTGAELLECVGKIAGTDAYHTVLSGTLTGKDSSEEAILTLAETAGVDRAAVQTCFDNGETKDLVADRFSTGQGIFGVTGTPGNIILNNETGEYTLISGAYPVDSFVETIDRMLGK